MSGFLKSSVASVFFICSTLAIGFSPLRINFVIGAWAQTKIQSRGQAGPQTEGKKTGGIVGDPSRQRGFELGYDAGPKAVSEVKAQNTNPDPSARPEYKKPEQFYRYEYGSRAAFIAGFRSGFMRGYKGAFGKMELIRSATFPNSRTVRTESLRAREPLQKLVGRADDAL